MAENAWIIVKDENEKIFSIEGVYSEDFYISQRTSNLIDKGFRLGIATYSADKSIDEVIKYFENQNYKYSEYSILDTCEGRPAPNKK